MESDEARANPKSFWTANPKSFWTANPNMHELNNQKKIDDESALIPNFNINPKGKRVYVDDSFVYPPGYRFCPHDEELIVHYLKKKVMNESLPHDKIKEVNLYKHSPQELSENYSMLGEKEWYFFTPRDRKYPNGDRPNRAAGTGYWKATGADKPIKHSNVKVGFRKALVFYEGKPPKGNKTNWIMHEFRVNESRRLKTHASDMRLDDWVLCRIYKKIDKSSSKAPARKEEHEQEHASKRNIPIGKVEVENHLNERAMYSCGEVNAQRLELPHHITDPNLYSQDNFSSYGVSDYETDLQSPLSSGNMYPDGNMNFDFNMFEIMGNVLNIGVPDGNSSIDKD